MPLYWYSSWICKLHPLWPYMGIAHEYVNEPPGGAYTTSNHKALPIALPNMLKMSCFFFFLCIFSQRIDLFYVQLSSNYMSGRMKKEKKKITITNLNVSILYLLCLLTNSRTERYFLKARIKRYVHRGALEMTSEVSFWFSETSTLCTKVNRKVQGMPQSQTPANPRHQEEEKKDNNIHAQNKHTNVRDAQRPAPSSPSEVIRMLKQME